MIKFNFLLFLALFCLFLLPSCERKFKVLESRKDKVDSIIIKVENLLGELNVLGEKRALFEIKRYGFLGEISTNFDGSNFNLSLKNLSGQTKLFLNNKKKISFDAFIAGGNLKIYGSKFDFERLHFEINGGVLEIDITKASNLIITNNVGNVKIRISKYLPVRLKLSSIASLLNIPEEFTFSNGYFYYLGDEKNFIDMDVYVNMGSFEISF